MRAPEGARPSRSSTVTSTARSPRRMPRPRSLPSIRSTSLRASPACGERRNAYSAGRSPSSHAKRNSTSSEWPNGVERSDPRPSKATGTPIPAKAVLSAGLTASIDGQTTAISSGGVPARIRSKTSSATSSSVPQALPLEEPDRAVELRAHGCVGEQVPLEMGQPRRQVVAGARRKFENGSTGQAARSGACAAVRRRPRGPARTAGTRGRRFSPRVHLSRHSAPVRSSKPCAKTGLEPDSSSVVGPLDRASPQASAIPRRRERRAPRGTRGPVE